MIGIEITKGFLMVCGGATGVIVSLIFLLSSQRRFRKQRKKMLDTIENE